MKTDLTPPHLGLVIFHADVADPRNNKICDLRSFLFCLFVCRFFTRVDFTEEQKCRIHWTQIEVMFFLALDIFCFRLCGGQLSNCKLNSMGESQMNFS